MVCAASGAGDSMQGMEVIAVSHAPKMLCCHKMSQKMEIMSNIERKKFALNVRRNGPQPSIFVRTLSAITTGLGFLCCASEFSTPCSELGIVGGEMGEDAHEQGGC